MACPFPWAQLSMQVDAARACETKGLPGCSLFGVCERAEVDDVGFTRELVKHIDQSINGVDFRQVYATGMSNGGYMSHRLACEASDMLAAVAPVSGVISSQDDAHTKARKPWSSQKWSCQPQRKVPVLHFHGQNDKLVSYNGGSFTGLFGFGYFNPVKDTIAKWLEINGAAALQSPSIRCPCLTRTNRPPVGLQAVSMWRFARLMTWVTLGLALLMKWVALALRPRKLAGNSSSSASAKIVVPKRTFSHFPPMALLNSFDFRATPSDALAKKHIM